MDKIVVSMSDSSFPPVYYSSPRELILNYSCTEHHVCSSMSFSLPRGRYFVECYGASGGSRNNVGTSTLVETKDKTRGCPEQNKVYVYRGNTKCNPYNTAGSGAYISGFFTISKTTKFYSRIGGSGVYATSYPPGGYNGGARGGTHSNGCASGGGSTDLRAENDDYFHRIIVAGGGGGCDDYSYDASSFSNDGSGGSAGYPEGQGFWINGVYDKTKIANQTSGFSFGQGEATTLSGDLCGAGGGWFGGFASNHGNGGCGGGSSFVLKKDAIIPVGELTEKKENGQTERTGTYKFSNKRKYLFDGVQYANGIWTGDGMMRITFAGKYFVCTRSIHSSKAFIVITLILSS